MSDIESLSAGLTPNMVRSLTWWCLNDTINSDVDDSTKRAIVRRGLGVWSSGQCVDLTEVGRQVREVLLAKQQAEEAAKTQALAEQLAAERAAARKLHDKETA